MASSSSSIHIPACLDFLLEISSSSSTGCIDFAVRYLRWLQFTYGSRSSDFMILEEKLRILKTFILFGRKCKRNHVYLECEEEILCANLGCISSISSRIQDMVYTNIWDLHSAYLSSSAGRIEDEVEELSSSAGGEVEELSSSASGDEDEVEELSSSTGGDEDEVEELSSWTGGDEDEVGENLRIFAEDIEFFEPYIMEFYIILSDDHYSMGLGDVRRLMDLIDSLVNNLKDLCGFADCPSYDANKALSENLIFLKNFIRFATMQGVDHMQLIDLLIHAQVVTVNVARLIHKVINADDNDIGLNRMEYEFSQLLHKTMPVDPQVRGTYVHVLTTSMLSRSSSSSDMFTLQKNGCSVAANIVSFILQHLWELLDCDTTAFMIPTNDQMQILCEGLNFLVALLTGQQEKFNKLHQKMKDLIGILLIDAGIMIFSLSVNETKKALAKEPDELLFHLGRVLKFVMTEVAQIYPLTSSSGFPRTNELGFIDFLHEKVKELVTCEANSIAFPKDQIRTVQEDVVSLKTFLEKIVKLRNQNEKLQDLWRRIMELAYRAEFVIDSLIVGANSECLDTVAQDIKLIKIEAQEIDGSMRYDTDGQRAANTSNRMPSQVSIPALSEVLVGLDDEVNTIVDRLTRGSKSFDIISVVGMPGLGKTTVANKVHHDPSIMCHFHIRAWCTISQVYTKHSLLLKILSDIVPGKDLLNKNEDDLAEMLYKRLKRIRYLIVLDDMWDLKAWNLLEGSFPNDNNGSRILFTSRSHNLCSQFKHDSTPHHLRPLTDEESWKLLQNKIFGKECCAPSLSAVGMQIAKSCKGLPLTVVIVAGILASIEQDSWEEVAVSLSSSIIIGTEHCMKILELSYSHLPDYLKPCLLYFGAFPEDQDIPVRKLIYLWISEGFVQKTEVKSLEDVAYDYLMDLIDRSLVMVTQKRSVGGVKTCRIHDLLHEFCVVKAKEESFLQILDGPNELYSFIVPYKSRRLRICYAKRDVFQKWRLFFPHLRSLLFFADFGHRRYDKPDYSFVFRRFKLLRVLDFGTMDLFFDFPTKVEFLVHLRCLAICGDIKCIPSSIAKLAWLETFIVRAGGNVELPNTIWNMKKLRHLCVERIFDPVGFKLPTENLKNPPDLHHLTLAIDPSSQSLHEILMKLPSIRRLKCMDFTATNPTRMCSGSLMLDFTSRIESLQVFGFCGAEFAFPLHLKKLTLSSVKLRSLSEISTIGKLPNLEVLKLKNTFVGSTWEMKEGEFSSLVFLGLYYLDIYTWTASCDNFPRLQKLVLCGCRMLKEVPSCLVEIPTIEMIEVRQCPKSAISSVKEILKEQMELGNDCLRVFYQED